MSTSVRVMSRASALEISDTVSSSSSSSSLFIHARSRGDISRRRIVSIFLVCMYVHAFPRRRQGRSSLTTAFDYRFLHDLLPCYAHTHTHVHGGSDGRLSDTVFEEHNVLAGRDFTYEIRHSLSLSLSLSLRIKSNENIQ